MSISTRCGARRLTARSASSSGATSSSHRCATRYGSGAAWSSAGEANRESALHTSPTAVTVRAASLSLEPQRPCPLSTHPIASGSWARQRPQQCSAIDRSAGPKTKNPPSTSVGSRDHGSARTSSSVRRPSLARSSSNGVVVNTASVSSTSPVGPPSCRTRTIRTAADGAALSSPATTSIAGSLRAPGRCSAVRMSCSCDSTSTSAGMTRRSLSFRADATPLDVTWRADTASAEEIRTVVADFLRDYRRAEPTPSSCSPIAPSAKATLIGLDSVRRTPRTSTRSPGQRADPQ